MISMLDHLYFALRGTTGRHGADVDDPIHEDDGRDDPILIDEVR